ncbi:Glycerol kinase [compost metagenome]
MQFQADIFGSAVIRPKTLETTALGAAYLAGLAVGYWSDIDEIKNQWAVDKRFEPAINDEKAVELLKYWKKAVTKSLSWIED